MAPCREQTVRSPFGPKGAFENGNIGALRLRAPLSQAVSFVPPGKRPRLPRTLRVVELLRKANEWKALLESGQIASQAEIARREGMTRARVARIMGMLRLATEIQEQILSMHKLMVRPPVTERMLRSIGRITNQSDQRQRFQKLLVLG